MTSITNNNYYWWLTILWPINNLLANKQSLTTGNNQWVISWLPINYSSMPMMSLMSSICFLCRNFLTKSFGRISSWIFTILYVPLSSTFTNSKSSRLKCRERNKQLLIVEPVLVIWPWVSRMGAPVIRLPISWRDNKKMNWKNNLMHGTCTCNILFTVEYTFLPSIPYGSFHKQHHQHLCNLEIPNKVEIKWNGTVQQSKLQ